MSSTASQILRLELIGTGDQVGTWGNTTNTNLGTLLEGAIAGLASVSVTSANQALTATDYAADQARMAILTLTTTTLAAFNVYAPPVSKTYVVYNNSAYDATIYNSTVLGNTTAAGLGVTIPAGRIVSVWSNGTDFYIAAVAGPASSTDNAVARFDGTTGKVVQNSGVTIDDSNNVGGLANLSFSGTGNRLIGDFSNATIADRVAFQTSTTNGETSLGVIPNGTSPNSGVNIFNAANPTNAAFGGLLVGATEFQIRSAITGSGTYLPMTFYTGGSERVRIDTSGNVGIGNTPSVKLDVQGAGTIRGFLTTTDAIKLGANTSAPTTTDAFIYRPANDTLAFGTASTEQVRIDSFGNVGIGVTPTERLTIASTPSITAALVRTANASGVVTYFGSSATTVGLVGTFSASSFVFYTNSSQRAQITSAGLFQIDNGYGSIATFYGCRAWVNFDGTGTPARRGNGNVSSITDNGVGDYTVNFTTAIVDANYAFTGAAESNIVGDARIVTARNGGISSSSCRITVRSDTNVAEDCPTVTFVVHR
jgi:hypothetical protein